MSTISRRKKFKISIPNLKLWYSWLAPLTYSLVHCLSWVKWLDFPTFKRVNVFFFFFFVPLPTQLSVQTTLFGFLPQSEGWIQRQTGELCSPGTGSLVVGMMFTLYYSWVRSLGGWQYINFEALINKTGVCPSIWLATTILCCSKMELSHKYSDAEISSRHTCTASRVISVLHRENAG